MLAGENCGNVNFCVSKIKDIFCVRLTYILLSTGQKIDYCIATTYSRLSWGKLRWWFVCPLIKHGIPCHRRVSNLYLPYGQKYFGCRYCYDLSYSSCQESHKFDRFINEIAQCLPSSSNLDLKLTLNGIKARLDKGVFDSFRENELSNTDIKNIKRLERRSKYLTIYEICKRAGLKLTQLSKLNQYHLLIPDTKDDKFRPKLVGWGIKLKKKLDEGWTCAEIKEWTKGRWA
jgi:hypothetical protein